MNCPNIPLPVYHRGNWKQLLTGKAKANPVGKNDIKNPKGVKIWKIGKR